MKKISLRILSVLVVIAMTLGMLALVNEVLLIKRTDGITTIKDFYSQKRDTVDVLFLGSSHSGMNLDMEELWTNYGISGYALWGSIQPFWNTYFFLVDALKTQSPRVVVLDVLAATKEDEYSDEARQVTNVAGMKLSMNKLRAIQASAPQSRWANLLLGLPIYHQRFAEIEEDDFNHFPWSKQQLYHKGSDARYGKQKYTFEEISEITEVKALLPKQEQYLRKIIEYCRSRGLPLVLIKTPTNNRASRQPYMNAVQNIADEYGIVFINYNLLDGETGIKDSDYYGGGHINTNGARKVTRCLAEYLQEKYNLADHRGELDYVSWDVFSRSLQNAYIKMITSVDDYFNELCRDDRCVILVKNSSWESNEQYETVVRALESIGVGEQIHAKAPGGDWLLTGTRKGELINQYKDNLYSEFEYEGTHFTVDFKDGTGISINGVSRYKLEGPGLIILVFDDQIKECVDVVTFLENDNFAFKRK